MRDLKSADWQFLPFNSTDWQDAASNQKPAVAEFTFQPSGTPIPITDDFWIPPTQATATMALTPAVAAVSANP